MIKLSKRYRKLAFTLVEMSVVLVVAALLVFAVSVGYSLKKNVVLKSVVDDMGGIATAVHEFEKTYGGLPGDLWNAQERFGTSTQNGNGDGIIDIATNEHLLFWQHLQLAGLIKGNYDGVTNKPGVGVMKGPIPRTGYYVRSEDADVISSNEYAPLFWYVAWNVIDRGMSAVGALPAGITQIAIPFPNDPATQNILRVARDKHGEIFDVGMENVYSQMTRKVAAGIPKVLRIGIAIYNDTNGNGTIQRIDTEDRIAVFTPVDALEIDKRYDDGVPSATGGLIYGLEGSSASGTCISSGKYNATNAGIACILEMVPGKEK